MKVSSTFSTPKRRSYLIVIENCPPSLKLLIRFHQLQLFSYSGIWLSKVKNGSVQIQSRATFFSIISIIGNIGMAAFFYSTFFYGDFSIQNMNKFINSKIKHNSHNESFIFENTEYEYLNTVVHLKPILRYLIHILRYIYLNDFSILYIWNLLYGGQVIQHLCSINVEQFDCDYRFIRNQIIQWLIIIIVLNVLGTVVFNMEDLQTLYQLVTFDSINENQRTRMNNTFYVVSLNSIHMIAQASSLLLFAYCQQIYCLKIEKLSNLTLPIDEKRLKHLKSSLMEMTENHQSMIQLFSCSIIVNLCTDMMLFIGNLCYIILHRPNSNNGQVISFVMVGALFSAIRLIISCTLSTKVIETHHYLARSIIERFRNWNLESWQTFNDIVRIGHKFRVSIGFEMFHVEQAAILPIMGFCFNYIVVLLQTENSLF